MSTRSTLRPLVLTLALSCLLVGRIPAAPPRHGDGAGAAVLANLAYLEHLTAPMTVGGVEVEGIAIYADAPEFRPVNAPGEGYTCVDDAARAAVVLLDHVRLHGSTEKLALARGLLRLVLQLQGADGLFWNFVDDQGRINRFGKTSRRSYDFWTSRGMWALGRGAEDFARHDPAFAALCAAAARKTRAALARRVARHGGSTRVGDRLFPDFLLLCGTDCWSEALLGLVALHRAHPSDEGRRLISRLADALAPCRAGTATRPPFGAFFVWAGRPWTWHGWGNRTALALIEAGEALGENSWIRAAEAEVKGFHAHLLSHGMLATIDPQPSEVPQIAYTLAPLVQSAAALARRGGPRAPTYAMYAGLLGAWFFGANPAGRAMYDPATGRCLDGIDRRVGATTEADAFAVNRNGGAESTLEALLAMLALEATPDALPYLDARPLRVGSRLVLCPSTPSWTPSTRFSVLRSGRHVLSACFDGRPVEAVTILLDGKAVCRLPAGLDPGPRTIVDLALSAGPHDLRLDRPCPALRWCTVVEASPKASWRLRRGDELTVDIR